MALTLILFAHCLWLLLTAHVLCDTVLQGGLSQMKNPTHNPPGSGQMPWQVAMLAHGMIHGTAVLLITGSFALCITEAVAHAIIDYMKCSGRIGIKTDQAMHAILKVLYAATVALS